MPARGLNAREPAGIEGDRVLRAQRRSSASTLVRVRVARGVRRAVNMRSGGATGEPGTARAGGMERSSQPAARAATARRTQFTSDAKEQKAEWRSRGALETRVD